MEKPINIIRQSLYDFKSNVEQAMYQFHQETGMHIIKIEFSVSFANNEISKVKINDIKLEPVVMHDFYND